SELPLDSDESTVKADAFLPLAFILIGSTSSSELSSLNTNFRTFADFLLEQLSLISLLPPVLSDPAQECL
ncbi:hypothetical protein U1Q18_051948, partial [Sarracenia purpurea var. burkii]